jgi:DUF4097 and DUF4098 domain-containing protein YvlB
MRTLLLALVLLTACEATPVGGTIDETFEITDEVTRLDLDNGNGNVFVNATAEDIITVQAQHHGDDSEAVPRVAGGILSLTTQCNTSDGPCTIDYTLWVPEAVEVDATTTTGDIVLVGMGGAANLITTSGNVELDSFTADTLLVTVDSGPTLGQRLAAEEVVVTSTSGFIDLVFEQRPRSVTGTTGSGDINYGVPIGMYAIDATATGGSVQISEDLVHDAASDAALTATTGQGDVTLTGL